MEEVKETLQAALSAFGPNGEYWIQGTFASMNRPFCCINTSFMRTSLPIAKAFELICEVGGFANGADSAKWNDDPQRTYFDVKELFEKAIARAGEEREP